jgi:hypothetical protein
MPIKFRQLIAASLTMVFSACGGADGPTYEELLARADALEVEARSLGTSTPCTSQAQCGILTFTSALPVCTTNSFKAYSIVSPTASQAAAAAEQQRILASKALAVSPYPPRPCPAISSPSPIAMCVDSTCAVVN